MAAALDSTVKSIVLVHGGFVDGSGWEEVTAEKAAFMADSQVPWGVGALSGTVSQAAWKTKPSWYLVATDDKMIPPPAQRFMSERAGSTVVEVAGSHAVYVSQPNAVAKCIEMAAQGAMSGSTR
jgi:pimeloyl-ACP methyl ester carboxylesterase